MDKDSWVLLLFPGPGFVLGFIIIMLVINTIATGSPFDDGHKRENHE